MTRARPWRVALGAGALALAFPVALLAEDTRRWPERMRAGDLSYRADALRPEPWSHAHEPARSLLALEDDLAFREALRLFRAGRPRQPDMRRRIDTVRAQLRAEGPLAAILVSDAPGARRSAAANMLGVLAYENYVRGGADPAVLLRRSLHGFRTAISIDPGNDAAKRNLELLLALLRTGRRQPDEDTGGGAQPGGGGAASVAAGRGY